MTRMWAGWLVFVVGLAVADNSAAGAASLVPGDAVVLDRVAVAVAGAEFELWRGRKNVAHRP